LAKCQQLYQIDQHDREAICKVMCWWLSTTNWQLKICQQQLWVLAVYIGSPVTCWQSFLTSFQFVSARALNTVKAIQLNQVAGEGAPTRPETKLNSKRVQPQTRVDSWPESSCLWVESGPSEARAHAHFAQIWQEANFKTGNIFSLRTWSGQQYEPCLRLGLVPVQFEYLVANRYSIMLGLSMYLCLWLPLRLICCGFVFYA